MFLTTTAIQSLERGSAVISQGSTHTEEYTDDDGVAEFDDVPVCTVKVYVNGDLQVEIGVGSGDHEDVTVTL